MSEQLDPAIKQLQEALKSPILVDGIGPSDPLTVNSWVPIPLDGEIGVDETPTILKVRGRGHLLYSGKTNMFHGESESGKTWLAVAAASEVLNDGGRVIWIDYEDTKNTLMSRLNTYGIDRSHWSRVDYINPVDPLTNSRDKNARTVGALQLEQLLTSHEYSLAIIDGISSAMGVESLDMNSANDVGTFTNALSNRLARHGAAVVLLTHITKSNDEKHKRDSLGSGQWRAQITGVDWLVTCTRPFGKATGVDTITGTLELRAAKDRPGSIRGGKAFESPIAIASVSCTPDGLLDIKITPPGDVVTTPPVDLVERIVSHLRTWPGATKTNIRDEVTGKTGTTLAAVSWLKENGAIVATGNKLNLNEVRLAELGY
jgi:hypothetical protein